jgi:large subunit ribosomal protein L6
MEKTKATKKDYTFEIEIPSEIEVDVKNNVITMKKAGKELKKIINEKVSVKKEGNKIVLEVKKAGKREKREFGTAKSHVKNMTEGLTKSYEYELEICIVHFPMTVSYDKAKKEFIIKNLLGEKAPRIIKSAGDVEVEIKAPKIKIKSHDLEAAGQTAANLEKVSKIRNRDRNKFQDGIFITKKPGVEYL